MELSARIDEVHEIVKETIEEYNKLKRQIDQLHGSGFFDIRYHERHMELITQRDELFSEGKERINKILSEFTEEEPEETELEAFEVFCLYARSALGTGVNGNEFSTELREVSFKFMNHDFDPVPVKGRKEKNEV